MFHGHLDYFQKPPLGGWPNIEPGDHGTSNTHNRWFILFHHVGRPTWIKIHWKKYLIKDPVTCDFTLHLRIHDHTTWCWRVSWDGLWTLSFGLSQFHGHGSWLMCEVDLMYITCSDCDKIMRVGYVSIAQIWRKMYIMSWGWKKLIVQHHSIQGDSIHRYGATIQCNSESIVVR